MRRFDENFNEIDPISGRPFSAGSPDGVWMIAIVYGLLIFGATIGLLFAVIKLFMGGGFLVGIYVAAAVVFGLYLPTVRFLLMRSAKALLFAWLIWGLDILALAAVLTFAPTLLVTIILVVVIQSFIVFYIHGLKNDNLLDAEATTKDD